MHPWSSKENIVACVHVYGQEIVEILYLTEVGLNSDLVQRSLIEALYDHAGVFEMGDG